MKCITKIINWLRKETWWRRHYKRITLDEKTTCGGRCIICDAGAYKAAFPRCDIKDRPCPCKQNQCLMRRIKS